MSDFGDYKLVKLRKPCLCSWCGQKMQKGETAQHFKGRWQAAWQDWRMHPECLADYQAGDTDSGFEPYANERPISKDRNSKLKK